MKQIVSADSKLYKWLILLNVMIGTFMAVLDSTVVNTGLPTIMGTLGTDINTVEWVLTAYMLALATVLPVAGWLADKYGYKLVFMLSLIVFTSGSFLCGNSTTIEELIFWRIYQGIGCGAIMPVGMAIVTNVFPAEQRGIALGFWAVASAASVSFGPSIGGYLVDNLNWNYIFFVNVPVGAFALFFTAILQKEFKNPDVHKFDAPGFITSVIFLPVFLYGLTEVNSATNPQGWNSPLVMGCMFIAFISFTLFIYIELKSKNPMMNLRLFKDRNFALSNLVMFVFGIGMFGSTFLVPLYLQNSLGYSAFQSGLFFIPVGILQGIASPLVGEWSQKFSPRFFIITGLTLLGISFYMNQSFSYLTDAHYISVSLYIRGLAMGMLFSPLVNMSLYNIPGRYMAQASSLINIIRQIGGSFGVTIMSYMLTKRVAFHTQIYNEALDNNGETYATVIRNLNQYVMQNAGASESLSHTYSSAIVNSHINMEAYIGGINDDFFIAAVITLFSILPVFFLTDKKFNK
ncbi:MAG: DHA2 family efflux MFS transporter permease subunit [Bacteroidales bacterium]